MLPVARAFNLPLLVTLHGYDVDLGRGGGGSLPDRVHWRAGRKELFRRTTRFLAVSQSLRERAIAAGFPADTTLAHYLGTRTDAVSPPLPLEARDGIVFVGRLAASKGAADLIEAVRLLADRGLSIPLRIVGGGPQREALDALAAARGVPVAFLGPLPREQAAAEMARARVFGLPARHEGFGLVFAEAQLRGTPVVAYADGGATEAVADGVTGLLGAVDDIPGLADRIGRLATDDTLWRRMSMAARAHVEVNFDVRRQAERLERLYDEVIGGWTY
jgi:glycosyltransferase involved in cell wall biosynthesis